MITTVMTVTGWLFWSALLALIVLEMILLGSADDERNDADDRYVWASLFAIAGILGLVLLTDAFADYRVIWIAIGLLAYMVAGIVWSFWRWVLFLKRKLVFFRKEYDHHVREEDWATYIKDRRPLAANNKSRIVASMFLWPWQFTWWIVKVPFRWLRQAFNWIYDRISGVYDRITAKVWQ